MVEIIEKKWTKNDLLNQLGKALNRKKALEELEQSTEEIDIEIQRWKERINNTE